MNINRSDIYDEISYLTDTYFLPQIYEQFDRYAEIVDELGKYIEIHFKEFENIYHENEEDRVAQLNNAKLLKSKVFDLIDNYYDDRNPASFDRQHQEFIDHINDFCHLLPEVISVPQEKARFQTVQGDKFWIRINKWAKRILFNLSNWPVYLGNIWRKAFNKAPKAPKQWMHDVHLRNLVTFHFRNQYGKGLVEIIGESFNITRSMLLEIWRIDELVDNKLPDLQAKSGVDIQSFMEFVTSDQQTQLDAIVEKYHGEKNTLRSLTKDQLKIAYYDFKESYSKAGTVECPNSNFKIEKLKKGFNQFEKYYLDRVKGWRNTFFALFEDWHLNSELFLLKYLALENYHRLTKNCNQRIQENLKPPIKEIGQVLEDSKKAFNQCSLTTEEDIKGFIYAERAKLESTIGHDLIPKTIEIMLDQKLPVQVSRIENRLKEQMSNFSQKRAIVKTEAFDKPMQASDLEYIAPNELINFEILPQFLRSTQEVKHHILENIEGVQNSLHELLQVTLFNLESANSVFEQDDKAENKPTVIASEGLSRAILKIEEVENTLDSIDDNITQEFGNAIRDLNAGLVGLTSTEKVFNVRLRIAKAKAIGKTKAMRKQAIDKAIFYWETSRDWVLKQIKYFDEQYDALLKQYGLARKTAPISSELSDFLGETGKSIEKLPFVYQRLFKIAPLEDKNFFEGHEQEVIEINAAYNNWIKDRYAPTIIIGENGSGKSTLINLFLNDLERDYLIVRKSCPVKLHNETMLLNFLQELFSTESFTSIEKVIKFVNQGNRKQIIIIENIQHLFLKSVDGFEGFKLLFELISKTNHRVFWLFSISLYTWNFLDKTLGMSDYFGYVIKVQELEDDKIIDMILKRHRVSGYKVEFKASDETKNLKQFKKLAPDQRQDYLKKQYFSSLNKFAKDNISLALLFWLRSAEDVTKDTIIIGNLDKLDFTFLDGLSMEKIFVLHAMILHDGLTEKQLAKVQNVSVAQSKLILLLMLDDGILSRNEEIYTINPLLYRHSVSVLKSKNLIQ